MKILKCKKTSNVTWRENSECLREWKWKVEPRFSCRISTSQTLLALSTLAIHGSSFILSLSPSCTEFFVLLCVCVCVLIVRSDIDLLRTGLFGREPPPVYVMRAFLLLLRLRAFLLQLLPLELRPPVLKPHFYLSFCEAEAVCELFPLRSDHIMVFLKGVFEAQQLRRRESCPDSFRLSSQRVVQKETLWTCFITLKPVSQVSISV